MSHCLNLLLLEFHVVFPMWGSAGMCESRDMNKLFHAQRAGCLHLWEWGIDNAFWELDKDKKKITQGIKQTCRAIKGYGKLHGSFTSVLPKENMLLVPILIVL